MAAGFAFKNRAILGANASAILALTMLVGFQTPSANSEITSVIDRWYWSGSGENLHRKKNIVMYGIGSPYSGVYGSNNPSWRITGIRPSEINYSIFLSSIRSINETLGDDLGRH